ncbi:MAG: hypothetical protein M3680_16650 [Myxococcota bacterium]|nr:hypothetical protein [Myxococcota bacterium]
MLRFALLAVALLATPAACHREPKPMTPKEGELPPLPPASGTAVGYLVDNAGQLQLRDDQLTTLKQLDTSLAARNDSLDTQLRAMERPDEQPAGKNEPPPRHNNAPGAQVKTTGDASKLHEAKAANSRDALTKAFAILDADQQTIARRLLDERGVALPGASSPPPPRSEESGVPLEP